MIGLILLALFVFLVADIACYWRADWPSHQTFMESLKKSSAWIPGSGFVAVYRHGWRR